MTQRFFHSIRNRFIAIALIGLTGCGGSSGPARFAVSGQVTVDGQPMENGTIAFVPQDGLIGPMAGGTITKGTYSIAAADGPTSGPHKVEIRAWKDVPRPAQKTPQNSTLSGLSAPNDGPTRKMYIRPEYNSSTKLSVHVEAGLVKDFEVKGIP